jgi:hypothetical protein
MEQFNLRDETKVNLDYADTELPISVRTFKPLVFQDGDSFCAVFGPDRNGVFGHGETPKAALLDWDRNLYFRIKESKIDDELVRYVIDTVVSQDFKF